MNEERRDVDTTDLDASPPDRTSDQDAPLSHEAAEADARGFEDPGTMRADRRDEDEVGDEDRTPLAPTGQEQTTAADDWTGAETMDDRGDERDDLSAQPMTTGVTDGTMPLFNAEEAERFRSRWTDIQTRFVDAPRDVVEQADHLVADVMQRLVAQFSDARSRLETQWDQNEDVSTEELRVALTRYRSFFERLLAA
jgi:hypothetical protein